MNQKNKKADLAINTVVIVILALVVLFVLLFIFGKQSSLFRYSLNDCESKQGKCMSSTECSDQKGQTLALSCGKTNPLKSADGSDSTTTDNSASEQVCCYLACESQQGSCIKKESCKSTDGKINYVLYTNCDNKGEVCCLNN
ncbi:hypothetical protein HZA96_04100 [Candidatus Woesearchaeota archaeon]|nr:hypothetical protein [Candidatus Woesearchaeota archaeon]